MSPIIQIAETDALISSAPKNIVAGFVILSATLIYGLFSSDKFVFRVLIILVGVMVFVMCLGAH